MSTNTITLANAESAQLALFLRDYAALLQDLADRFDRLGQMHQAGETRERADQAHDFAMRFEQLALTRRPA